MKILLLEDEYSLAQSMVEFLRDIGYEVDSYGDGDLAMEGVFTNRYDLMLLDVKVPGINGFDFLKLLRDSDIQTPAIFITSLSDVDNLVKGYDIGCCDYIKKPFDLKELQIRVEHALKRECLQSHKKLIKLNDTYSYDTQKFLLLENGKDIELAKTQKRILECLIKHRGSVVSIEQFHDEVWGEYVDPANVRVQINKLRKNFNQDLIINVRGLGYKIDT
jgi:DNA-binding response OmpR family regulator